MKLQPAQQTFLAESRDLLRDMESAVLHLEGAPEDEDAVNAVFRAVHTIKGSGGVFEYTDIVEFTHALESVLVEVRAGRVAVDPALAGLLLSCGDHVVCQLGAIESGRELGPEERSVARELVGRLEGYVDVYEVALASAPDSRGPEVAVGSVDKLDAATVQSDTWHISARFGREVMRSGMDPLSIVRYLGTLGRVVSVQALFDAMPKAAAMNPESCYVGLELEFSGKADKQTIEGAFDFVRDDSDVRILPPHSKIADYIDLIESLPEENTRLGELLVASGALTDNELAIGLAQQQASGRRAQADGGEAQRKIGEILVGQGVLPNELVDAALEKQRVAREHKAKEARLVRVHADKLDELINVVGELVIASSGMSVMTRRAAHGELAEMTETAGTLERLVEEVRDRALKLRMVPIGETFGRFRRVVHDLGRELGKDVELELSGTETELDKSMVEKISDPLMHLVRNAIDHGLEGGEVRVERGKPARGHLRLNAYHESGSIVIEVTDDGRGLDREKILRRAVERGLASADQPLGDRDVLRMIMEPGFSTADEVTNVSGRGVGMDVVRRNVEALHGTIAIDSVEGDGTTISIRLPLTLAIIEGFAVGIGSAAYVIPLEMVVECLELTAEERARVGEAESGYINLRGELLPLLRLREVFGVQGGAAKRENIVVVRYGAQQAGFVVDSLMGEFQTVIKPLGRLFERLSGISGSTVLGTGEVALILDAQALVQRAVGAEAARESGRGERRLQEKW